MTRRHYLLPAGVLLVLLLAAPVSAPVSAPVFAGPSSATEANLRVVDRLIIPGYRQLSAASAGLDQAAREFCASPGAEGLSALRRAYQATADAWQSIQFVRFGPVDAELRYHRFQLWPDRRNATQRHLDRALAAQDLEALEPKRFAAGSVAIQGLGALERLLFPSEAVAVEAFVDDGRPNYHCALVRAIGANLAAMSREVERAWTAEDAYRERFATAAAGNAVYADEIAAAAALFQALRTQLDAVLLEKLRPPLGEGIESARPKRAEAWRSGRSLRNIGLNLNAARGLYELGFAGRLQDPELDRGLRHGFEDAAAALAAVALPLAQAVTNPDQREQLWVLRGHLDTLNEDLRVRLAGALGIPVAFNSLDGD